LALVEVPTTQVQVHHERQGVSRLRPLWPGRTLPSFRPLNGRWRAARAGSRPIPRQFLSLDLIQKPLGLSRIRLCKLRKILMERERHNVTAP
jgi:hypothetical protein